MGAKGEGRRGRCLNCLHNSLNPCSLVIVLKADDGGMRSSKVSVKEEEMVSKHD